MRVTRDLLINLAREQATKLAAKDRSLQCVLLIGSLLREGSFLGGVTDIDLVCVHDRPPKLEREIVRINADVHLDIVHLPDDTFTPPKKLRVNPWLGGTLDLGPMNLYDRYHWFDFIRASASAQFWQTENVIARARFFSGQARQTWQTLMDENPQGLKRTQLYLDALNHTANSLAVFSGMPLTTRHFILDLPERISKLDINDFTGPFVGLFSNESVEAAVIEKWRGQWLASFDAVAALKTGPMQYCATRRNYYDKAIEVMAADHPAAALWILLRTWTDLAAFLPKTETLYREWQSFLKALDLDNKGVAERLPLLDNLLDLVENTIDQKQQESA